MGFLNKSDVKNHLATHDRFGKRLYRPSNLADASGQKSGSADDGRAIENSLGAPGLESTQRISEDGSKPVSVSAAPKSAQE
jgi:hypothetical protein